MQFQACRQPAPSRWSDSFPRAPVAEVAVTRLPARDGSVNSATTLFCVLRSERGCSGTAGAVPVRFGRSFFFRSDSHGPAVAPDHGVLTEPPLSIQGFGDGVAQDVQRLLVLGGQPVHGCASFTSWLLTVWLKIVLLSPS